MNHPASFVALLILLGVSYSLGYLRGAYNTTARSSEPVVHRQLATQCANPVPPELVCQTIIDLVYNGTSPYEGFTFTPPTVSSSLQPKIIVGWSSYRATYSSLIHKVRPNTIIKFNTFLGESAIYMANLTRQLGLETQILCLDDDFHGWPGPRDLFEDIAMPNGDIILNQFMQNVISQIETKSIMPVPLSATTALEKLCEWGIFGDLIEVDAALDFHSAWSDINRAYKLLRPGGVLFGLTSYHNKGVREAVKLFARVNKFRVKATRQHWMIDSA